jgi:hypothetical protein
VRAEREGRFARERHAEADRIDPDTDQKGREDEEEARRNREVAEHYDKR